MSATLKRKSDQSEVPVEWVDDNEWNAIEDLFDAISSKPGVDRADWSRPPSTNLSMVPSILLSSAPHQFSSALPGGQSSVPRQIPERLQQTVSPNGSWRNLGCQFSSRSILPGGRAWMQCADQCPEFPSGDSPSGEQTDVDSRLPASRSEIAQPVDEDGSKEAIKERSVRRLPAWMEQDVPLNNEIRLVQPQAGLPWGLQPSTCVDVLKPKFPAFQFQGKIVYSKTESEVKAATVELWQRVRELQQTTRGAVPIGFDLEWRATFERGEIPRKVAVLQLCLDGRRCDVIQIIYSGIPTSLQDLLEAPSTLKVGVGVYGDAARLHQDYHVLTRKIVDLRVVANQKMRNLKQWSLASLALELTGKQVEKIPSIRCGDWEALPLSQSQLLYAATDAFASLHLYQVLASFPNPVSESNQNDSDHKKTDVEPPAS